MFTKNFKIFVKQLLRNKSFSFITIAGFSFALMFVILLSVYVRQEFSVDNFHEKKDRIYRLVTDKSSNFPPPMGEYLMDKYPEIENFSRFYIGGGTVGADDSEKHSIKYLFVDSSFYNIFSFKVLEGNPKEMLRSKGSIVLVDSYARKLFGSENPMGREINLNGRVNLVVTGIIEDFGPNTHFPSTNGLVNFNAIEDIWGYKGLLSEYSNSSFALYLLAKPSADLHSKIPKILTDFKENFWLFQRGFATDLSLEPIEDVYFSKKGGVGEDKNNKTIVLVFSSIVVLILILAVINYVNLSLAQSSFRSREVAVKKLFGSSRGGIFSQFIIESVLLCLLSFTLYHVVPNISDPKIKHLLNTKLKNIDEF